MQRKAMGPIGTALMIVISLSLGGEVFAADKKPNILVIWGDDIGVHSVHDRAIWQEPLR